jgi:DNA-binding response OmpR family regulator
MTLTERLVKTGLKQPRILVVDDEPGTVDMLKLYFEMMHFEVTAALTGNDALIALADKPYDVMILDMMLPDIDGTEVCRKLRSQPQTATLPVIILSARTSKEDVRKGYEAGATLYLKKPVDLERLLTDTRQAIQVGHHVAPTLMPPDEDDTGSHPVIAEVSKTPNAVKEPTANGNGAKPLTGIPLQSRIAPASSNKD